MFPSEIISPGQANLIHVLSVIVLLTILLTWQVMSRVYILRKRFVASIVHIIQHQVLECAFMYGLICQALDISDVGVHIQI